MDGNVVPARDGGGTPSSEYRAEAHLFVQYSPFPLALYFHRRDGVERVCARNESADAQKFLKVLNTQTEPHLDTRFFRFCFGWTRHNYCSVRCSWVFHARVTTIYYPYILMLERP